MAAVALDKRNYNARQGKVCLSCTMQTDTEPRNIEGIDKDMRIQLLVKTMYEDGRRVQVFEVIVTTRPRTFHDRESA